MSNNVKSYAKTVLDGYDDALSKLTQRYNSAVAVINREHNARLKDINEKEKKDKNSADAKNQISLRNTKATLADKGLLASGESAQADIDHNLARNIAFSEIEENASRERSENERSRADAKANAFASYLDNAGEVELKKNSEYRAQLNSDRDYEAERDDETHRRYVENRKYEAERDDEAYSRYADNRDYEAERDDEAYSRYADNRDYEAERDDEKYSRYADNRDYEAKREGEENESAPESVGGIGKGEGSGEDNRIEPKISPKDFVDTVKRKYAPTDYISMKIKAKIRKVLDVVINDPTLTFSYRHQVKIYAQAMGVY